MCIERKNFLKNFQDTISHVKFPVESKSELRIGVKKRGNQEIENKQKTENFEMNIDIYRYSDSGNRFSGKFYVDFMSPIFFFIFFCLNTIIQSK